MSGSSGSLRHVEPESDRAVVDQMYFHMGTELPDFHPRMRGACQFHQSIEPAAPMFGRRGAGEAGPHARACIGGQGELADQQQTTAGIGQAAIHPALLIGEHAIAEQALEHAPGLRLAVIGLHGNESEQAVADGADGARFDVDAGGLDALDERDHLGSVVNSAAARPVSRKWERPLIPGSLTICSFCLPLTIYRRRSRGLTHSACAPIYISS